MSANEMGSAVVFSPSRARDGGDGRDGTGVGVRAFFIRRIDGFV